MANVGLQNPVRATSYGMEKIFIKPDSKEIVLRGKPEEGHVDVFSYNYENAAANGLGGLFIVGHIQPGTEDTSYMINLVASLAKREYYAKSDEAPRESFSKTLKKINEVLQDFFRNKEIKVNIGIFAIAGENILISRLGKFKIVLSRDNQNIDILNNINLFNKEHIQEKEFSNIISGKIMPQDKIFAFYPGRSIVAREKTLKADFTKLGVEDFSEKLNSIKKANDAFLCAGIHITINKHTEPAVIVPPQPQELRAEQPKAVLTRTSKAKEKTAIIPEVLPDVRPIPEKVKPVVPTTPSIKVEPMPIKPEVKEELKPKNPSGSNVYYPGNKGLSADIQPKPDPSPMIRPTEFSSGKKEGFLESILRKYKPSGIYTIGKEPLVSRKTMMLALFITMAIIGGAVGAKLTFIPSLPVPGITSPEEKAVGELIQKAEAGLESAKAQINQNNLFEARKTLRSYYEALEAETNKTEHLNKIEGDILATLDEIDKAVGSSPSLLYQISQDIGKGSILAYAKDKILVYTSGEADSGSLLTTTESGIENTTKVSNFNPLYLLGGEQLVIMVNNLTDKLAALTLKDGGIKTSSLALSGTVVNVYPYQNNLYILTSDGIYKIVDVTQGKSNAVPWLEDNENLPINSALITVDSKIFIMSENGVLAAYYKGKKESEVNTSIPVSPDDVLLTNPESSFLYLVDKQIGRIYVLNKSNGSLEKTIKLESDQPLISASMSDTGTIYLLTSDNKVWKVTP